MIEKNDNIILEEEDIKNMTPNQQREFIKSMQEISNEDIGNELSKEEIDQLNGAIATYNRFKPKKEKKEPVKVDMKQFIRNGIGLNKKPDTLAMANINKYILSNINKEKKEK